MQTTSESGGGGGGGVTFECERDIYFVLHERVGVSFVQDVRFAWYCVQLVQVSCLYFA